MTDPTKSSGTLPMVDTIGERLGIDVRKLMDLGPVASRHLVGEARDQLYVRSGGKVDMTKPRRFYGILKERCNLKCQGCHYWRMPEYGPELDAEGWIRVLADIKDFVGPFHINFSGGEPLLMHGLFDVLNYCRDNEILAGMTTNAMILRDRQAQELVDARLFSLNISLDGFKDETHDLQRGVKGSHARVLRTVKLMQDYSEKTGVPVPIVIKPTVSRLNYEEMPDLVRLTADLGVNGILFQPIGDWGTDEIDNLWVRDFDRLQAVVDEMLDLKRQGYPILSADWHIQDWVRHFKKEARDDIPGENEDVKCWVGITTLVIKTDGTLANCHTLEPIGNVHQGSIRDIWYSAVGKQRRAESTSCTLACSENCTVKRPINQKLRGALKLLRA